jgi:hypothetical protein
MENFNSGNWFANRKKFNFQEFTVEGVTFNLIPLTDELTESVTEGETLAEMLTLAADYGISSGRLRIVDDTVMFEDMADFWALDELNVECSPSIKHQVGQKVCEISGDLAEYVQVVRDVEAEKAETEANMVKVGEHELDGRDSIDNLNDTNIDVGDLDADATQHAANMAIAS